MSTPDDARLADLRRRLYRPGATAEDIRAYTATVDLPPAPAREPSAGAEPDAVARPSRRLLLVAAGGAAAIGGAAVIARAVLQPPSLGPTERAAVHWRPVAGAAAISAASVRSGRAAVAMGAVPFERSRTDVATRAVYFGAGAGGLDFDVRRYYVGSSLVTVTLVTDRDATVTVQVGALTGIAGRARMVAVTADGTAAAGVAQWASSPVGPFDRPQTLRVGADAAVSYVLRVEFAGPPQSDF